MLRSGLSRDARHAALMRPNPAWRVAYEEVVRRFMLFWVVFALVLVGLGRLIAQEEGWEQAAQVAATYQEADEGYFSFGQDVMVVAKPGSDLQKWLKARVGQRMRLKIERDDRK